MVGDCLFSSEAKLWSREELCEVCVLRDKVPMSYATEEKEAETARTELRKGKGSKKESKGEGTSGSADTEVQSDAC